MITVQFKYAGQSSIVQGLDKARMSLATNTLREAAFFRGTLARPLLLREALGALRDVVVSDFKYHPRDHAAFKEWLEEQDRKFVAGLSMRSEPARKRMEALEVDLAALDQRRESRMAPFYRARKKYFDYVFHHEYELNYLLDPVITVHPDEISFEAFSKDESSYGRLGARYDLFEKIHEFECGTTNIDFSARLATELDRMRTYRRTDFDISPGGFSVKVGAAETYKEKKIELPESWLEGFLQVQSTMTMGLVHVELAPIDLFNVCRFLRMKRAARSPRALRWELTPGKPAKVVFEPWEHAITLGPTSVFKGAKAEVIRTWGRDRLRVLSRLLPVTRKVDVFLAGFGRPTIYVLDLGELSFTLALSGWTDNDWTGGAKFDLLARRLDATPEELMLVYETLRQQKKSTDQALAQRVALDVVKTRSVLSHLCQVGRAMYDLSTRQYRHRDLFFDPFTLKDAVKAVAPKQTEKTKEAVAAKVMQAAGDVRIIARRAFTAGFKLSGSAKGGDGQRVRPQLTVGLDGEIVDGTCTCSWFRSHALTKGPCEHLLGLRLAHIERVEAEKKGGN